MFAPRKQSTIIELSQGDERFFRLPPMSNGFVQVNAFHADVSLAGGGGRRQPKRMLSQPRVGGPRFNPLGPAVIALDDDGGGGPHSDTSPARNLELELRHSEHLKVQHPNLIIAQSLWHDDLWRLRVKRRQDPNDLTPNPGRYRIEVSYTSQLPVVERRIPAGFFHEGFELNWNRQQYVGASIDGTILVVNFDNDLKQLQGAEDISIDISPLEARGHTTSVNLDVGAGPPPGGGGNTLFFSARANFAAGELRIPANPDESFPAFTVTVRLYLQLFEGQLMYVPTVEGDVFFELADEIPGVDGDELKEELEKELRQLQFPPQSGFSKFGEFLAPWLIGDRRELFSLGYAPGPGDAPGPDGIIEPATGDLILSYVGPRTKPSTEPVLTADIEGTSTPPGDDGSVRLFDLPDEEPDPVPGEDGGGGGFGPFGGGGALPRPRIGALAKIDHIVVLMQENRSFDQVLGYLSLPVDQTGRGRTDVNGLVADPLNNNQFNHFKGRNLVPQRADANNPRRGAPPRDKATAWPSFTVPGPCHDTDCVLSQIDNSMGRFVADFAKRLGVDNPADSPNLRLVMDYFTADQLPVFAMLAEEFGICDAWYTSHAGPTWPNRFVLLTGDLNLDPFGNVETDNPDLKTLIPLQTPTLFDHLNEWGASWRVFEHGYSFIRLFKNFTFDTTNVVWFDDPVRGFEAAARAGNLPQVTLLEPDYIDLPPGNDDHPPADMADGQDLVKRIVQALVDGPAWERTLLVITYDEHGGFYDHQPVPTDAPPLRGGRRTLGPRVPTFVVSPLIERGKVFTKENPGRFDHTSIGATILRRFAGRRPLPRVSPRLDAALDLRGTLTLDQPRPRSEFDSLFASLAMPVPAIPARRSVERRTLRARAERVGLLEERDDFHRLLSLVRLVTGEAPR